jgi:hypothetical protein
VHGEVQFNIKQSSFILWALLGFQTVVSSQAMHHACVRNMTLFSSSKQRPLIQYCLSTGYRDWSPGSIRVRASRVLVWRQLYSECEIVGGSQLRQDVPSE